jgi:hypothetical protein
MLVVVTDDKPTRPTIKFFPRHARGEGVFTAMKNSVKQFFFVVSMLFIAVNATHAQINASTGTVIVLEVTDDEVVIAADSRGTTIGKTPDDTQCKIAAFKSHHAVFAATGATVVVMDKLGWDAISDAKQSFIENAYSSSENARALISVGMAWAQKAVTAWGLMLTRYPDTTRKLANDRGGNLATGIFGGAIGNQIDLIGVNLRLSADHISTQPNDLQSLCFNHPCAWGHAETEDKYVRSGKNYMTASPKMLKKYGDPLLRVVRLVELTIAEDKSRAVGGRIDALSLRKDGSIRWYRKKPNCPESSD